jgi:hypothetical protein
MPHLWHQQQAAQVWEVGLPHLLLRWQRQAVALPEHAHVGKPCCEYVELALVFCLPKLACMGHVMLGRWQYIYMMAVLFNLALLSFYAVAFCKFVSHRGRSASIFSQSTCVQV